MIFIVDLYIVESLIEELLSNYCHVIEENSRLAHELDHCTEKVQKYSDVEPFSNQLNDVAKDEKHDGQNAGLHDELEELQRQLEDRENKIDELSEELNRLMAAKPIQSENPAPKPSIACKSPVREIDTFSLQTTSDLLQKVPTSDDSYSLRDTIRELDRISLNIEKMLNEKDVHLKSHQDEICHLTMKLETCSKNVPLESHQLKLEESEERNQILAQQTAMLEEQVSILMDERKKLIEINNELSKSISVCQVELSKYNFE